MTKKELIEALDGLDDNARVYAEIGTCICGKVSAIECDLEIKNVYEDCAVLYGSLS